MAKEPVDCLLCKGSDWSLQANFPTRPETEIDYGFVNYDRSLWRCENCGHFVNSYGPGIDMSSLYDGAYWDSTYASKIEETFNRIMSLPVKQSDNRGRVKYIINFFDKYGVNLPKEGLDIGSGLAVFPAVMKEVGWNFTALDPDPKAATHAKYVAKVPSITANYMSEEISGTYSLITLNKVLEHVPNMIGMLSKVKKNLSDGGFVYVELPDGEKAIGESLGPLQGEFMVEHYYAFSMASYCLLAQKAGFQVLEVERITEPSGKYTMRGFLQIAP